MSEVSECIEIFQSMKEARAEKRAANRVASAAILARAGVVFEEKNAGAHLIVLAGRQTVDFWPSTGLWIVRGSKDQRRGVRKLIAYVETQRNGGAL